MRTPVNNRKLIESLGTKDSDKTPIKLKHYQVVKLWRSLVKEYFAYYNKSDFYKELFGNVTLRPIIKKCLALKFDKFGIVKVRVRRVSKKIEYDDAYIYVKRHFPSLINKIEAELY